MEQEKYISYCNAIKNAKGSNFIPYGEADFWGEKQYTDTGFLGKYPILLFIIILATFYYFSRNLTLSIIFSIIITIKSSGRLIRRSDDESASIEIDDLKNRILNHNQKFFNNFIDEKLNILKIETVDKEIILNNNTRHYQYEKILINDTNHNLAYIKLAIVNTTGEQKVHELIKVNYSEILKYDLVDKGTRELITGSSMQQSVIGAVTSQILIDNPTVGAIIGASGEKTTKEMKDEEYQINIYLNKLDNSLITINYLQKNKVNEIISVLEYILNKNKNSD